jgi:uncharacterized coiled-coil DUF342 family protein
MKFVKFLVKLESIVMSLRESLDRIHEHTQDLVDAAKVEREQVTEVLQRLSEISVKQEQIIEELRQNQVDVSELEKVSENLVNLKTDIETIFVPETK